MNITLAGFIKELKELINNGEAVEPHQGFTASDALRDICKKLADTTNSGVYVFSNRGKLLLFETAKGGKQLFRLKTNTVGRYVDKRLSDRFDRIYDTKINIDLSAYFVKNLAAGEPLYGSPSTDPAELNATLTPISAYNEKLGVMIMIGAKHSFNTDYIVLTELCSMLSALLITHEQKLENAEELRRTNNVRSSIATLSYSELEAILHIFEELPGSEGVLIASKIADKIGITRSIIVNALRKLESAGLIESRSLGMKGTYIRVLNTALIDELKKMQR